MKNKKAFTLIELLVVIAVLAGMMALLVPNYMEIRKKARDVKRKNDLKGIQKALELYKINQTLPAYPAALTVCSSLSTGGNDFMKVIPPDPSSSCASSPVSYYYAPSASFTTYTLCACLELKNDPDQTACTGAPTCPTNSSGMYYKLTEP